MLGPLFDRRSCITQTKEDLSSNDTGNWSSVFVDGFEYGGCDTWRDKGVETSSSFSLVLDSRHEGDTHLT